MHTEAHRGKGNDKIDPPNKGQPSKQNRKTFNKQRKEYQKKQYPKLPPSSFKQKPQN